MILVLAFLWAVIAVIVFFRYCYYSCYCCTVVLLFLANITCGCVVEVIIVDVVDGNERRCGSSAKYWRCPTLYKTKNFTCDSMNDGVCFVSF